MCVWNWLKENEPGITAVASTITAIGLVLSAVAIFLSYRAIEESQKSLASSTIYNLQKDGRELLRSIQADKKVYSYIYYFDETQNYPPEVEEAGDAKIAEIIQFITAVFNQRRNKAIPDLFWVTFEREFCTFLREKAVALYFRETVLRSDGYSQEFKRWGASCS